MRKTKTKTKTKNNTKTICVLAGDGIGQEVMAQTIRVLNAVSEKFNRTFTIQEGLIGGAAFDKFSVHFPTETKKLCKNSDAVLFGSVGGPIQESYLPKWKNCERKSILALRKALKLNANIRPATVYPDLQEVSPLKASVIAKGIDLLIVRELLGDAYFGEHRKFTENEIRYASDVAEYSELQISSVAHRSFQLAKKRNQKVTSVDKANVLETSKLWREVVSKVAKSYPEIICEHMLIDNCAMQLVLDPSQFDVILTSNMFGDILSDVAAALPGSLGLIPSASFSNSGFGLYEPAGGSAPDIAGKNIANPIAQILSLVMLLRYSFNLDTEASAIERAIQRTIQSGFRTQDIYTEGKKLVGTQEFTDEIIKHLKDMNASRYT